MSRLVNGVLTLGLVACGAALAHSILVGMAFTADAKIVQLKWYGHSWFVIEASDGTKVAIDPHAIVEYGNPSLSVDVCLHTHQHDDHNRGREVLANGEKVKVLEGCVFNEKTKKIDWNEVKETVKGVKIRSVGTYHDTEDGKKRGKNSVFVVEADGLTFVHLGDLGHELSDEQVKEIGKVDVLLVPVGGIYTLNGEKAKAVIEQLKPRLYVVPMHYNTGVNADVSLLQGLDEFLDGQKSIRKLQDGNVLPIPTDAKPEKPSVILLGWK